MFVTSIGVFKGRIPTLHRSFEAIGEGVKAREIQEAVVARKDEESGESGTREVEMVKLAEVTETWEQIAHLGWTLWTVGVYEHRDFGRICKVQCIRIEGIECRQQLRHAMIDYEKTVQ